MNIFKRKHNPHVFVKLASGTVIRVSGKVEGNGVREMLKAAKEFPSYVEVWVK